MNIFTKIQKNLFLKLMLLSSIVVDLQQETVAQKTIVFIDSKFLVCDTLKFDFDGQWLAGTVNVKNFSGRKDRQHTWLFGSNVTLNTPTNKRGNIDADLNGIKMRYSFDDLYLQVAPDFNKPSELIVKTALSQDTVYRAVLQYPILDMNVIAPDLGLVFENDTTIKVHIQNKGLADLTIKLGVVSENFLCTFDSVQTLQANQSKEINIGVTPKKGDFKNGEILIWACNEQISINRIERKIHLMVPVGINKNKETAGGAWLFVLILILGAMGFIFREKIPFNKLKKENKKLPQEIENLQNAFNDLIHHYNKQGIKSLPDALAQFAKEVDVIIPHEKKDEEESPKTKPAKKIKVQPEFDRKEIVQRASLKKYINDQGLHERLLALSEVELVKYIGLKFKDAAVLQKILAVDDQLTRSNLYTHFIGLRKKEKKENEPKEIVKDRMVAKKQIKVSAPKVITAKPTKITNYKYEKADEYVDLLKKLEFLMQQVLDLDWDLSLSLSLLKSKFMGYFGIKENRLRQYIETIEKQGIPKDGFDATALNVFTHLFTELYNLQSFAYVPAYKSEFEKIRFPFVLFSDTLSNIANYLNRKSGITFIVPVLFKEVYNPTLHNNSDDVSKILAENLLEIEDNIPSGTIKDYSSIGVVSSKLGLNLKANVYTVR